MEFQTMYIVAFSNPIRPKVFFLSSYFYRTNYLTLLVESFMCDKMQVVQMQVDKNAVYKS